MNITRYIQREFGTVLDKPLEMIMKDFWEEASKGMFIPQTLGGHGLMSIRVYLRNEAEFVSYNVGREKHIDLFSSNGLKILTFIHEFATTTSKIKLEKFLKTHKTHEVYLEFRFWADEDSHKLICRDCTKEILIAYTEEDEEWIQKIPQYDIAAMPNDLRDILYDLVRKGISIDYFKVGIDKLILKAKYLLHKEK